MNTMFVSPLLKLSPDGPFSSELNDLVHLRQGDLDGACGPYCIISALIALGLMDRQNIQENMHRWKGSAREGRFRDALFSFGVWTNEGTTADDLLWLTEFYKRKGLDAYHGSGSKKELVKNICFELESGNLPILAVDWNGGGAHWLLVVGYQGIEKDDDIQLTHLLCLDPGQNTPTISLWNAMIHVFNDDGSSSNPGYMSSQYLGMDRNSLKCQIRDVVVLSLPGK